MKVFELLTIPHLNEMKMIAGESGKDNDIQTVNMMDAPDIIDFLKPNEYLVTTAYHFKDNPHLLSNLVKAMSEQGCAALGLKTKRFLQEIPTDAIQLADQLSLPIIELPLELSLGEVINHVLQAILDKRATELTQALETHKKFTQMIMQGKGIQPLLRDLSQMIDDPLQLTDQHFNLIYTPNPKSEFLLLNDLLQTEKYSLPAWNKHPLSFSDISNKQTYSLFPLQMGKKKMGFLIINGDIKKMDYLASLIIEQAINVLLFALMKENALREHDAKIRNDFFLHFLDDAFSSEEEIINRAAKFSLSNDQPYICVVGKIDEEVHHHTYTERQQKIEDIYDFIEDEVTNILPNIHFFTKGLSCILLYEIQEKTTNPSVYIQPFLQQLQEKVSTYFESTISFGVSYVCHTFLHVRDAFNEAVAALSQGALLKNTAYIQPYQTKDIMELLRMIPRNELENFYSFSLSGFTKKNTEDEQSLLETLFVYVETNCQISETAKRLFVHRNTVIYRIEKCEEILKKHIKDPETTLQIRLALRIRSLL